MIHSESVTVAHLGESRLRLENNWMFAVPLWVDEMDLVLGSKVPSSIGCFNHRTSAAGATGFIAGTMPDGL